jgi:hypothetical protein
VRLGIARRTSHTESATTADMKFFAEREGLKLYSVHQEIYLADPRRVAPAKLRTILRHPVERIEM